VQVSWSDSRSDFWLGQHHTSDHWSLSLSKILELYLEVQVNACACGSPFMYLLLPHKCLHHYISIATCLLQQWDDLFQIVPATFWYVSPIFPVFIISFHVSPQSGFTFVSLPHALLDIIQTPIPLIILIIYIMTNLSGVIISSWKALLYFLKGSYTHIIC